MWAEDRSQIYRSAEEGTQCFNCSYWHGNCPDALENALNWCVDFNMITKKEWENMETERTKKENRVFDLLNPNG